MNFDLSDDQRMLKDSLDTLVMGNVDTRQVVDLGLTMLPFAAKDGGLDLGGVEMMLVGEAFGRGLVTVPFLPNVVLAGTALRLASPSAARARAISGLITGEKCFAVIDRDTPDIVIGGDVAESFVLIGGDTVALVDASKVERRCFKLHNGWGAAAVAFDAAVAQPLDVIPDIGSRIEQAAIAWLSASAVGAMQAAVDLTIGYLKTREQFGKPIGNNQALAHRVAEMLVELEAGRSMAIYAAHMMHDTDFEERVRAFSAIKIVINKCSRFIGQQAVQLHGGIGVSDEYIIGRYFKHLTVIGQLFGDSDYHADNLAAVGGFTGAALFWD